MSAKYYGTEKVGKTFEYNGKKYKVMQRKKEEDRCLGCDMKGTLGCYRMVCVRIVKVYYKEVK